MLDMLKKAKSFLLGNLVKFLAGAVFGLALLLWVQTGRLDDAKETARKYQLSNISLQETIVNSRLAMGSAQDTEDRRDESDASITEAEDAIVGTEDNGSKCISSPAVAASFEWLRELRAAETDATASDGDN